MEAESLGDLLADIFPVACSIFFLSSLRTTFPEVALPTVSWAPIPQSLIKKMHYRIACLTETFSQLRVLLLK